MGAGPVTESPPGERRDRGKAPAARAVRPLPAPSAQPAGERFAVTLLGIYALLVPWEVSKTLFPVLTVDEIGGRPVSALEFPRIWMGVVVLLVVPVALGRGARFRRLPAVGLIVATATITVFSFMLAPIGSSVGPGELLRLAFNATALLTFAAVPARPEDLRRLTRWVINGGTVAAAVVLAQFALGFSLWPGFPATGRYTGVVFDANHAARYFLVAAALAFFVPYRTGRGRVTWWSVAQPALLVVAILLTGSRSILFLVAAALGLAVILGSPAQRLAGLAAVGPVLAAGTVAVALFPSLSERAATLTSLDALLGARRSLLEGAWRMFLDHPLFGMGAGGFSAGLLTDYSEFQSYYGAELNYSHTSLATIAAEQGLVGLALLAAWIVTMWVAARRARRWGPTFDVGTGAAVGLMLIFVASQSESRLFEDPYLWVLAGLLLGAARMARQAQRPVHPELEASGERD